MSKTTMAGARKLPGTESVERSALTLRPDARPTMPQLRRMLRAAGTISTSPQNAREMPTAYRVVRYVGGEWVPLAGDAQPRRRRGDRVSAQPPTPRRDVYTARVVACDFVPADRERDARTVIERGLAKGSAVFSGRTVRLSLTLTGGVKILPDRGPVETWASVDALVDAYARGLV